MKKIIYFFASLILIVSISSCRKHMQHVSKQIVIDTLLASGASYSLNLTSYGDADDVAIITKQGTSYTVSEITNMAGTFAPVYHYTALAKTSVTDQVVLSVTEGSRGTGSRHAGCDDFTTITINFTIK